MPLQISIELQLSRQRIEALLELYDYVLKDWVPENNAEHLLCCHAQAMQFQLHSQLSRTKETSIVIKPMQKNNRKPKTLKVFMAERDAVAFMLTWSEYTISHPLANITVNEIIGTIDKQSKTLHYAK